MSDARLEQYPIAIIGAGPVGLAAAVHLLAHGLPVKIYEAGTGVATNLKDWGHVHVFTPWRYCVDPAAQALLEKHGWVMPALEAFPTGAELVRDYLEPLAALPELAGVIETGARVKAIARRGIDKVSSRDRAAHPFLLTIETDNGRRSDPARAVIDASGTWTSPNPLGASGLPAEGEAEGAARIAYGIPDLLGRDRARYAGQRVLVVGAGHSAANVLLDLARLGEEEPATRAIWVTRGRDLSRVFGGGAGDQLPARGALGADLRQLVDSGRIELVSGFALERIAQEEDGLVVHGVTQDGPRRIGPVDRIVAATGQRPDLSLTRELRLDLDPWLESAKALGPLIDPNLHSCGSVPPHGHRALSHPEPGFYTIGVKSYGRAPTFLMLTGYEQARSVAAALAGDMAAADAVRLVLPETGVCQTTAQPDLAGGASGGCCGGPAPAEVEACCVADAVAKDKGKAGCGFGVPA